VNAGKYKILLPFLLVSFTFQMAFAGSARVSTRQGNHLYEQGKFDEAIKQYDQALIDSPEVLEPKFNKANSFYQLDDIDRAVSLYREVAAESKDMKLVTKAKYNLGNCSFQQGCKQRDSNLRKAIEDMETAIGYWRGVLDIEPENEKAANNIEVARLTIKDILDQLKNQQQQQDPNQPQDPNQFQQQQEQNQQQQGRDPNQSQDQQQQQDSKEDPNQLQETEKQQQEQEQQQAAADTTAQEILDKEQRDKKQRQILQRARYQKVEKDW
jgi:Ca-activated chloride channel family protein